MISSLPRFRRDLTVSRQVCAGATVFVIKDPVKGRFYRLPEEAHFIAEQLDGATPLEEVRARAEKQFHTRVPPEEFKAFVRQLTQSGLLESEGSSSPRRRRRIQGGPLLLRVRFFDPDRLFNRLIGWIQFFYTPYFVAFAVAAIVAATCVLVFNWDGMVQNFRSVYQPSVIPLFFALGFLVVTAHEFAHGLTCKHFGGEVHELGFLLIYFQPAFYCNVSDAWLFPEKSRRLWVGFAGPFFELFLWALCVMLWRATDQEAWLHRAAFVVMTTSGVKTLFNFNPLIKLDGYYLLSDWLGIPNLRKRAFASAGDLFKRFFGVHTPRFEQLAPRERRVLLTYGLVATAGSVAILALAVTKLGGYLIKNNQPLAFLLFAGTLGQKMRRRFDYLFGKSSAATDDADDDAPDTASDSGASAETPPTPEKPQKKMTGLLNRYLAFTAGGAVVLAFMWYQKSELRISGPFDTLPIRNADVRAGVDGIVSEIGVDEGSVVHQGDLIAQLSDVDVRAQLAQVEGQIAENQAKLKLLENGPRPEEIEVARVAVAKSEADVKYAQSRLDRDQLLFDAKLEAKQIVEDSEANLADQQNALATARGQLALLLAGSRPEDIAAAKGETASLTAQRDYLEAQLRLMKIYSPANGVVATPSRELHEMVRQFVKKGDLIAKVFDLKTIIAEIPVSERDIAEVKTGQKVLLKARAYPGITFNGTVTSIAVMAQAAPTSGSSSGNLLPPMSTQAGPAASVAPKTFLVTTEIDNPSLLLKPEMTGQAKIMCGRRSLFGLAARQVARAFNVSLWSWW